MKVLANIIYSKFMGKSLLIRSIMIGFVSFLVWGGVIMPQTINADLNNTTNSSKSTLVDPNGHLTLCKLDPKAYHVVRTIKNAVLTAYSSSIDETDDTPFDGAGGNLPDIIAKTGLKVIATNILPLGTKVRIGDDIYVVYDRMNPKYNQKAHFDEYIPGPSASAKKIARKFGYKIVNVEVIES
jgi:3D (Asp-Asp-Asp) domain-containing protein